MEVIGVLVGNFFGKPKKYSDLYFKALKVPNFLAQYPKNTDFTENVSFLLDMEPKNTRISFLHKTFPKKSQNQEFYTLKNTTSIPITLPWKCPPPGQN